MRTRLVRENKVDAFNQLAGQVGDVTVSSGELTINTNGNTPQISAEIAVSDFDVGLLAEALLGRSSATNTLAYVEPEFDAAFSTAYYPNLKADLKLNAERIAIGAAA